MTVNPCTGWDYETMRTKGMFLAWFKNSKLSRLTSLWTTFFYVKTESITFLWSICQNPRLKFLFTWLDSHYLDRWNSLST